MQGPLAPASTGCSRCWPQHGHALDDAADGLSGRPGRRVEQIGDLAAANGITLHELATQRGSLEEAFIQLTGDSVEYTSHGMPDGLHTMTPGGPPAPGLRPTTRLGGCCRLPARPREGM